MKRWIYFLGHLAIITILTSFASMGIAHSSNEVPMDLRNLGNEEFLVLTQVESENNGNTFFSSQLSNNFIGFKEALGFKESRGNYFVVNTLGYLGKYQFGANTLKLMGVYDASDFLKNPKLQETIFELNVSRNKWILRRDIKRFVGKKINGVVITESGIVASAHLAGAGNVKKYLRSYGQIDFSDAYGSTIAHYMKRFEGYDISNVKARHNPKV